MAVLVRTRYLVYRRDLLMELVLRDIKIRYKRSVLGLLWSFLNPLSQLLVLGFVFGVVLPLNIANYPLFLFSGVLAWNWLSSSLVSAATSVTDNRQLIRQPGFPASMLPAVAVATNLVHFLLALPVLLIFGILGTGGFTVAIAALPVVIGLQFLFTLGIAYLVAAFHVTFRDTQYLLGLVLMLGFYLTPIFYDSAAVPAQYYGIYRLNPMLYLVNAYRAILIRGELPDGFDLLVLTLLSSVLLWVGHSVFVRRASKRFVEEL